MKIVVQKSLESSVEVNNHIVGKIKKGLILLVGFTHNDSEKEIDYMVKKIINLRIFNDENNVMNKNVIESKGSILSISQFTLYGNANKGNRPSYIEAAKPEQAAMLYSLFNNKLSEHIKVETGTFGADMKVSIINDGPTTIILEK